MAKFKAGDRVRLLLDQGRGLLAGAKGTVLEESRAPYVSWDGFREGHSGGGRVSDHSAYAVRDDEIELTTAAKTRDPLAVLIALGIITPSQADAARELAQVSP